jgi:transcriptional regulator with XRE-family HTH domain
MPTKESALRKLRRARTLNQEQMAGLLDVSQQTYSKYESGVIVPPPDRQAQIAAILGTSVEALWPQPKALAS